jgi:hypothetical protein
MEPVNLTDYKHATDLVNLIAADLGQEPKRAGKWMTFSCPFPGHKHGDKNRSLVVVNPSVSRAGYWKCYGCHENGSAVDWMMKYRNLTIKDVVKQIAGAAPLPAAPVRETALPEPPACNLAWENRGIEFMQLSQEYLWNKAGTQARDYLMNTRRLSEGMLKTWDIGFNPASRFEKYSDWGLPEPDDGQRHAVYIPRGIVIPCFEGGELYYLKIRTLPGEEKPDEPKYRKVTGSRPGLVGLATVLNVETVFAVEGEFNLMPLWSAINRRDDWNRLGCFSTGSASDIESITFNARYFLGARRIIAVYDNDKAGAAAFARLTKISGQVSRATVPGYKDINDYHIAGGDLSAWLDYQMEVITCAC